MQSVMSGHEKINDPSCVKSRPDHVITVTDCSVLWQSKLWSEIALSTMEAEVIRLAHSCMDLPPIIDMVISLGDIVGLFKRSDYHVCTNSWE